MDDLLKDAIADAKAVRETALANAKIALEEAFTPRLQSMLSKKIASEMEDKEETEDSEEMREEDDAEEEMEEAMHDKEEGEHEEGEHEEMRDADEMEHEEEMDKEEEMDAEEMRDAEEMEHEEEMDSEEMRDAEEMEHEEEMDKEEMRNSEEEMDSEEEMEEMEDKEEDELDLESVLAELEKDLDDEDKMDEMEDKDEEDKVDEEMSDKEEEDKVDENDVSSEIGKADNKLAPAAGDSSKVGQGPEGEGSDKKAGSELGDHTVVKENEDAEENDLDLDEVLRALTEEDKEEEDAEENEKLKSEIKEHRKVIHFMRSKLNEVNLLNAKLLFSNKLFRAFGLNNNQKLKVVETFDRTKNLREVKLVYATLAESFKKPGNRLSESVKKGSASKPVRSTKPKAVLSEGQELKARFKKLANIL